MTLIDNAPNRAFLRLIALFLSACIVLFLPTLHAQAQTFLIEGTIANIERQAIPGASLRIAGSNLGTYSDTRGRFRLTSPTKEALVRVSSLGYETREILLSADSLPSIVLTPLPIRLQSVEVGAGISAEDIIRQAIERKTQNLRTVQTLSRRVYTKLQVGTALKTFIGKPSSEKFITETVAQVYESFVPKRTSHTVILQRRQTANFPTQANILNSAELVNLLNDEIIINETRLRSPLAASALSFYDYSLIERKAYSSNNVRLSNSTVYIIGFKPKSRAFPGLEGTIAIIEHSFAPISADFTTSPANAVSALSNIRYAQTFEPFGDSARAVWLPTNSRFSGTLSANFALLNVDAEVNLQSIVSNVEVLQTLPPSAALPTVTSTLTKIQRKNSPVRSAKLSDSAFITLAPTVDSVDTQFWKTASLLEYTAQEDSLYRATDSVAQVRIKAGRRTATESFDSTLTALENSLLIQQSSLPYFTQTSLFRFQLGSATTLGFAPILMQPRTTGRIYGIETALDWERSSVRLDVMASERWQWFGALKLVQRIIADEVGGLGLIGEAFSRVRSFQPRPLEGAGWIGTATDFALFEHHYDFYREEGVSLGAKAALGRLEASVSGQLFRTSAMTLPNNTTPNTRLNLAAANSDFRVVRGEIAWNPSAVAPLGNVQVGDTTFITARLSALLGEDVLQNRPFTKFEASATLVQPTFFTGYSPMHLILSARAGMVSEFAPAQERFILFRRYPYLGNRGDFLTPEISTIGGSRMVSFRVEHNFSDLAWRAIGLPTYKGRGLELIAHAGTALYEQSLAWLTETGSPKGTEAWYTEVGFGIGRIPLFIIDFITLRFDAAWSVGNASIGAIDGGRFGWSVSVNFSL
ncbi:MAG: DUF5686 and carboxypeptidase regulatory-like domain-containing protein [Candidatus Kapabacteria bacterium]|nr:DUF5686 and carboxypeptidase regulatory-like domain-containing protein [Candidatus Kapabacteria bacterium]